MSETEHIRGKIKLIRFPSGTTFAQKMVELGKNHTFSDFDFDIEDEYIDQSTGLISANGEIYEVLEKSDHSDADISNLRKINSETYEFEFKFYNGGACFSEMLEDALKKAEL